MGPTLIFDKSFLQSLSVDEAVMLDQMFTCVITPLFFVETMADLTKTAQRGKTAEQIVGGLAERTPVVHSYISTFHQHLLLQDLLGHCVDMDYRPVVAGGIPVALDGKSGVVFKKSPEAEAFERWQCGRFLDVERIAAHAWRASLNDLDLPALAKAFRSLLRREAIPKNHQQAKSLAMALIDTPGQDYRSLEMALELLWIPYNAFSNIKQTWRAKGPHPLRTYAPYAAYCLEVDLYFYLAMSNGIISDQRASNRVDIGYLYYLPFANILVSTDKLHRAAASLFTGNHQCFVWGPDLKADLADLNARFLALPEEEKKRGLFKLARQPAMDQNGLCARLWDQFRPGWREPTLAFSNHEQDGEIIKHGNKLLNAATSAPAYINGPMPPFDEANNVIVERHIPRLRGSWRMFSADVEAAEDAESD